MEIEDSLCDLTCYILIKFLADLQKAFPPREFEYCSSALVLCRESGIEMAANEVLRNEQLSNRSRRSRNARDERERDKNDVYKSVDTDQTCHPNPRPFSGFTE